MVPEVDTRRSRQLFIFFALLLFAAAGVCWLLGCESYVRSILIHNAIAVLLIPYLDAYLHARR